MPYPRAALLASLLLIGALFVSCGDEPTLEMLPPPMVGSIHDFAHGCYQVVGAGADGSAGRLLQRTEEGDAYAFEGLRMAEADAFTLQPSDLGTYVFYDRDGHYLVSDDEALLRQQELVSDAVTNDDETDPGAEWELEVSAHDDSSFQLLHRRSGRYLGMESLVDTAEDAAVVSFIASEGCATYPELTIDAEGTVTPTSFEDGSLFGIVDTHEHILSNFAFGGGGIFHGAAFHPLGVEHALPDCDGSHGAQGRKDLFGYTFDTGELDQDVLLATLVGGRTPDPNHVTAGYPEFTEWPSAPFRATHQMQYWRWLERAWMGGLRLVVQHATSNRVICELMTGANVQDARYSCDDMVAADRIIEETYAMERYIDAQMGGPGEGFFRIVKSPAEARDVIAAGKMAVVIGIETSHLFDCYVAPRPGEPTCDEAYVLEQLDRYHDMGVRVLFPVHKFDNAFSAGDGQRAFIELGNFIQSGHWSSYVSDCPDVPSVFDKGSVEFAGLNMPRADYDGPPPNDMSGFPDNPIGTLVPFIDLVTEGGSLEGDYCQGHGLTPLGEFLMSEMMKRGMIIEVDHMPRKAYVRAFEILEANDYPAAGTHGLNFNGRLYALGGVSKSGFGTCHDAANPGSSDDGYQARIQLIRDNGGFPAEGFGFDMNGFAGGRKPRFGERSGCTDQTNPVSYPFTSYGGDVTFTEPHLGNRTVDFNTEGMSHIGLLPEYIQDVRNDGVTDEELEPLFKSAEGYIRMWEKAEERSATLR